MWFRTSLLPIRLSRLSDRPARRPRPGAPPPVLENLETRIVPAVLFEPNPLRTAYYAGGLVIPNARVEMIFWGPNWNAGDQLVADTMNAAAEVVGGAYTSRLAQYGIGQPTLDPVPRFLPDPVPQPGYFVADLANLLANDFANPNGVLPKPATNNQLYYYVVPQVGSNLPEGYGAVHYFGTYLGTPFHFGSGANPTVLPNNVASRLDWLSVGFSHELVESVSDPEVTGWYVDRLPIAANELCDNNAQFYTYRVNGILVASYFSQIDHAFVVPDGNSQALVLSNYVTRILSVAGDQLPNPNDDIRLDLDATNGVLVTLNNQVFDFDATVFLFGGRTINGIITIPGGGTNTATVAASNVPIHVNFLLGTGDTLNVGAPDVDRRLDKIRAPLWAVGHADDVNLIFNDQDNPAANTTYTLDRQRMVRTAQGAQPVFFHYRRVRSLTLNTGAQNKTVNIKATEPRTPTTVNLNAGNVTLNVGDPTRRRRTVSSIRGPLTVNSQAAVVDATVNDQDDTRNGRVYTLTAGRLTRTGGFVFNFDTLRTLTVNTGSGNDTVRVASAQAGTTIRGGGGNNTVSIQGLISTAQVTLVNIQVVRVDGGGTFNVVNDLTVRDVVVNNGSLNVQNGTLTATGMFTQPGGTTTVSPGADLTVAGGVAIQGGTLTGSGTVTGNVTNAGMIAGWLTVVGNVVNNGLVSPGDGGNLGVLTVGGNYTQTAAGALGIKVAGGNSDHLLVGGVVTLDGGLFVIPVGPPTADSYDIVANLGPAAINGIFAGLPEDAPVVVAGETYHITYMGGAGRDVVLHMAMKEPTVFVYNVPGFNPPLVPPVACGIIAGAITNWNQVGGPNLPVTFVYRLDPDDTTADMNAFTTAFCGFGVPPFPVGIGRVGGQAVADTVAATPGAIGYVSQNIARGDGLPFQPVPKIEGEPPGAGDRARGISLTVAAALAPGGVALDGSPQAEGTSPPPSFLVPGDHRLDRFFASARPDDASRASPRAQVSPLDEDIDWALEAVGLDDALLT